MAPPRLPSEVVFELSPLHRVADAAASDSRLRSRKPSRGAGAFLYLRAKYSFIISVIVMVLDKAKDNFNL